MIDPFLAELRRRLRGPARVTADLLAEARDGLIDAAEAYERGGLDRPAAHAQAVADFGAVEEVAAGYQSELGIAQGRRTARLLLIVLIGQAIAWGEVWPAIRPTPLAHPAPEFTALSGLVDWLGAAALVGSLAAVVVLRLRTVPGWAVRATGAFALGAVGSLTVVSLVLAIVGPRAGTLLAPSVGLPWTLAFLVAPTASVAVSGYRCLTV